MKILIMFLAFQVHLYDGRRYAGYVEAIDPEGDLALVRIKEVLRLKYFILFQSNAIMDDRGSYFFVSRPDYQH